MAIVTALRWAGARYLANQRLFFHQRNSALNPHRRGSLLPTLRPISSVAKAKLEPTQSIIVVNELT
jgi:hypothetical protein